MKAFELSEAASMEEIDRRGFGLEEGEKSCMDKA
jgi:hypothetical protein